MSCQTCKSNRVASISGKCSDRCDILLGGKEYSGYVPDCQFGKWGDYLQFDLCLDCGQMQGKFPMELNVEALHDDPDE